jgi:redox-sensitive bicupin YhaK (pirin superfamily)
MGSLWPISRVFRSVPTIEDAGIRMKRAFGYQEVPALDPFLLFDKFYLKNPGTRRMVRADRDEHRRGAPDGFFRNS